jgi:hypothetical protein
MNTMSRGDMVALSIIIILVAILILYFLYHIYVGICYLFGPKGYRILKKVDEYYIQWKTIFGWYRYCSSSFSSLREAQEDMRSRIMKDKERERKRKTRTEVIDEVSLDQFDTDLQTKEKKLDLNPVEYERKKKSDLKKLLSIRGDLDARD